MAGFGFWWRMLSWCRRRHAARLSARATDPAYFADLVPLLTDTRDRHGRN
jgi:hypothetical protein